MEIILIPFLVLLLIVLLLVLPSTATRQRAIEHEQALADMQAVSDATKQRISDLHRAYRTDLARAAKTRSAARRRMR